MSYQHSKSLLPKELMERIQEYVEGQVIYIPKKTEHKKHWGENTDTRQFLDSRNKEIRLEFQRGRSVKQLSESYFLTEKSIQRILMQGQRKKQ